MKIIIIGPVYPYKGGIAHYTGLMAKNLAKQHDVQVISFKMQYPKILYRGKEQKDFENDSFKFDNTVYLVNTINPFSYIKTARFIKKQSPDLIIVQWWHPYFVPAYWSILKLLKKRLKVIFLCHNVLPHDKIPIQLALTKAVLSKGNAFILHSDTDENDLRRIVQDPLYRKAVHPTYDTFKLTGISKEDARKVLEVKPEERMMLFFGFIREYKGLKHLIRAMPQITNSIPNAKLFIVGEFFENNREEYLDLINSTKCEDSIRLYDGYTPDKEVEKFFAACDVVVLPYESATQSGIVQIAYGFEKPVIATNVGGLPEVVLDGKTGFIVPPSDSDALTYAIIRFFKSNDTEVFINHICEEAYRFSWDRMLETVEDLCMKIVHPSQRQQ